MTLTGSPRQEGAPPHFATGAELPDAAKAERPDQPSVGSPIARRVAAALIVAGILALVLLGVGAWWTYRLAVGEARALTHTMTRLVASQVERLFDAGDLMLRQMADQAAETDWSKPGAREAAEERLHQLRGALPISFRLFLWSPDGSLRASTVPNIAPELRVTGRDYFEAQASADAGLYISRPLQARIDSTPILVLSRRINGPDGRFLGIASFSVGSKDLARLYQSLELPEGWVVGWVHKRKGILLREPALPPDIPREQGIPAAIVERIAQGEEQGWASYRSAIDGVARRAHFVSLSQYPIVVVVAASDRAVLEAWFRRSLPYFGVGLVAVAAMAIAGLGALRWARAEDRRRTALTGLNAELERRVAARTATLVGLIAERDALISQKDTLIQEVNHRAKNSLQQVASMLRLQSISLPQGQAREVIEDARSRVMAIGMVHERLYGSDFTGLIDMQDYLQALCAEMQTAAGGECTIALDGDPVRLPLARAVPLALLLNELLTNAIKHARRPDGGCAIRVSFGRADPEKLKLVVQDDGPGLPPGFEPGKGTGLGMRLIQIFAQQLEGDLEIAAGDGGACFSLAFPEEVA